LLSLFFKRFKKPPSKIYIGIIAVVPRKDFKRHFEFSIIKEDIDSKLKAQLEKVLSLPKAPEPENASENDLALDIFISDYQLGKALFFEPTGFGLPFFWRPKIELNSRLYSIKTNKRIATFTVTTKMRWAYYLRRVFSWRGFFSLKSLFDSTDMQYLLYEALLLLLIKVKKKV
jgi:hypothetical protein